MPEDHIYDTPKQPTIRVAPKGLLNYQKKLEEKPIPLQTLKDGHVNNKEAGVKSNDVDVLIDIGEAEGSGVAVDTVKPKDNTKPIDSGFNEESFNQTMIYQGSYNYPQLSSSMQPSAPSPSFVASPQFSSTLNPFQHSTKTPRSPEESSNPFLHSTKTPRSPAESVFQGYNSLQVSIVF